MARRSLTRRSMIAPLALLAACLAPLASPAESHGGQVIYTGRGASTSAAPLSVGGITATAGGGARLNIDNTSGLGVVGGGSLISDLVINNSESVTFRFDAGPATGVSFASMVAVFGSEYLEGFDALGGSLGTVAFDTFAVIVPQSFDVSGAFGGSALSAFRIFGNGRDSGVSVARINFTPQVAAVPEPSSLAATGIGLAALGAVRLRRRRAA